jgi:hypothetical protein
MPAYLFRGVFVRAIRTLRTGSSCTVCLPLGRSASIFILQPLTKFLWQTHILRLALRSCFESHGLSNRAAAIADFPPSALRPTPRIRSVQRFTNTHTRNGRQRWHVAIPMIRISPGQSRGRWTRTGRWIRPSGKGRLVVLINPRHRSSM